MEYKINSIVINTINNTTRLYKSLVDNNTSSLNNTSVFIEAFMYGIRNNTPEGWLRCDGNEYPTSAFQIFINNYLLTENLKIYDTIHEK